MAHGIADEQTGEDDWIALTSDPIDAARVTDSVRSTRCGAVLLFLGTVREMTGGRKTARLTYEAYPEMAHAQMVGLAREARARWSIEAVAMVHRTGTLELGEISVAIAVASPHRKEAFAAGEWLIDELKRIVPIWKQDHWADGVTRWQSEDQAAPPAATSQIEK